MNSKQFVAREQMRAKGNMDAEMTGPMMHEDSYRHKTGTGGAGGSPVKYVKREGSLEGREAMHKCGHLKDRMKGPQSNFD